MVLLWRAFESLFPCIVLAGSASGGKVAYNQFNHFISLCRWLLTTIGHDIDLGGGTDSLKYSSPQIIAAALSALSGCLVVRIVDACDVVLGLVLWQWLLCATLDVLNE